MMLCLVKFYFHLENWGIGFRLTHAMDVYHQALSYPIEG